MKLLVCTDGSGHSKKALEKAAIIADGYNVKEVAIIHVYDNTKSYPVASKNIRPEQRKNFINMMEKHKVEQSEKILSESLKFFKGKNTKTRTILKEGPPSQTIVKLAQEEGFNIIVIGSERLDGLKNIFLGSVSNAVIRDATNCSVLIVR